MAYVAYTEELGVFIGTCMGLAFWSKLDPVGQHVAATFESPESGRAFMSEWNDGEPAGIRFVQVDADVDGTHASIAACVRAGLPGWIDEITPVANALPV